MLENILQYKKELFFLINHTSTSFLDCFMWLVSKTQIWTPLFISFLFILIYKKNWREWIPVLIIMALVLLFCDQFSSNICKPFFARLRPTHHPDFMSEVRTLYGYKGGMYGFISGHATNAFGFATITALLFQNKNYSYTIYGIAFVIAYSRIYLGVHFVSDILAGSIAGFTIGLIMYRIYLVCIRRIYRGTKKYTIISVQRIKTLSIIMICYISIIFLYSTLCCQ